MDENSKNTTDELKKKIEVFEEKAKEANEKVKEKNKQVKEKARNTGRRITMFFTTLGVVVVVLGGMIVYLGATSGKFIGEKTEITNIVLEEKLMAIGELSTYSFEYTNEKRVKNAREIFGQTIPWTTNEVDIIYTGVIKVGYEISEIECEISDSKKLIFVTIPKVKVMDNYIKLDGLQCKEKNNILNPIGTKQITGYFEEIEKEELNRAIEQGIYEKAEEQLRVIIAELFAAFDGYDVVFRE